MEVTLPVCENGPAGLLRPDEGTVFIEDYNVTESPRAAKRVLGLVP
jgi:ABC-type sugar transport system ATPase subunit